MLEIGEKIHILNSTFKDPCDGIAKLWKWSARKEFSLICLNEFDAAQFDRLAGGGHSRWERGLQLRVGQLPLVHHQQPCRSIAAVAFDQQRSHAPAAARARPVMTCLSPSNRNVLLARAAPSREWEFGWAAKLTLFHFEKKEKFWRCALGRAYQQRHSGHVHRFQNGPFPWQDLAKTGDRNYKSELKCSSVALKWK